MALLPRRTVRIGVTGLARAGKTAFLTSVYANLLAQGAGYAALPALAQALAGRSMRVAVAPAGAEAMPRFAGDAHLAALAADPPAWPARTGAVSLLALDLDIGRSRFGLQLPPVRLRLELLDYPGEWLLDLPLLRQEYGAWSAATLARMARWPGVGSVPAFLAFVSALPAGAPADGAVLAHGARLYARALQDLRAEGLSLLQPGRTLMPAPGPAPPWAELFPVRAPGSIADTLAARYRQYADAVLRDLSSPLFGSLDRLIILADLLSALHGGTDALDDAAAALGAAAAALTWRQSWAETLWSLARLRRPSGGIGRVAWAATKADHVSLGQRGNLSALLGVLTHGTGQPGRIQPGDVPSGRFAIASIRCTADGIMRLGDRAVSAVEGRLEGYGLVRSYPGEVPPALPDAQFWEGEFFAMPDFQPPKLDRLHQGVPQLGVDALLAFVLADLL